MNNLYCYFNNWIAAWIDIVCGMIGVVTFTICRPRWDFEFRAWSGKRTLKRMMRSNITGEALPNYKKDNIMIKFCHYCGKQIIQELSERNNERRQLTATVGTRRTAVEGNAGRD